MYVAIVICNDVPVSISVLPIYFKSFIECNILLKYNNCTKTITKH